MANSSTAAGLQAFIDTTLSNQGRILEEFGFTAPDNRNTPFPKSDSIRRRDVEAIRKFLRGPMIVGFLRVFDADNHSSRRASTSQMRAPSRE